MPENSVNIESIEYKIKNHIPDADVVVVDMTGGNDHFAVSVTSKQFEGLNRIKQHQLIYEALNDDIKERIHALKIQTFVKN